MVFISLFLTTVLTEDIFSVHVVNNAGPKVIFFLINSLDPTLT